jgi:hypothetical protein
MKTFTLEQINNVFRNRHYLTRERFLYYFTLKYGLSDYEAERRWDTYQQFPYWDSNRADEMDDLLEKVDELIKIIQIGVYRYDRQLKPIRKQVHYKVGDELRVYEFDLNVYADIILYAKLLEPEQSTPVEIVATLDFVDEFYDNNKTEHVYDGDIFVTTDESYSRSYYDNIYVCDGGKYKRLLYTKGKGYVRNDSPDYDEGSYNHHVLTSCKKHKKIGNIYLDMSVLIDNPLKGL